MWQATRHAAALRFELIEREHGDVITGAALDDVIGERVDTQHEAQAGAGFGDAEHRLHLALRAADHAAQARLVQNIPVPRKPTDNGDGPRWWTRFKGSNASAQEQQQQQRNRKEKRA